MLYVGPAHFLRRPKKLYKTALYLEIDPPIDPRIDPVRISVRFGGETTPFPARIDPPRFRPWIDDFEPIFAPRRVSLPSGHRGAAARRPCLFCSGCSRGPSWSQVWPRPAARGCARPVIYRVGLGRKPSACLSQFGN